MNTTPCLKTVDISKPKKKAMEQYNKLSVSSPYREIPENAKYRRGEVIIEPLLNLCPRMILEILLPTNIATKPKKNSYLYWKIML
jgi:hypothetical protein